MVDVVSNDLTTAELLEQSDVLLRIDQLGARDVIDPPRRRGIGQGRRGCGGAVGAGNEGVGAIAMFVVHRPS